MSADAILTLLQGKSSVRLLTGSFVGFDVAGGRMLVDFDQGRVPAHPVTAWRPEPTSLVWVAVVDGVAYVVGPAVNPPADGTVVSTASGIATISTDIGNIEATYNSGVTLTAGQEVKLLAGNGYHVIGVKSTSPAAKVAEEAPGATVRGHTVEFGARGDSGSYRAGSGWWQSQVWASDNNLGAWFYDNTIADTIPAHATGFTVEIYLSVVQKYGSAPNFALHSYATRPGGSPSLSSSTAVSFGGSGWLTLPASFGDALKSGGGSRGIGLNHGGYNKFASPAADPMSGRLRISYTA